MDGHRIVLVTGATGFIGAHLLEGLLAAGHTVVALHRRGQAIGSNKSIDSLSSDPAITALQIGGPGSGSLARSW